eukprot:11182257-Lingulodinium_polyedra.AAC.1
MSKTCWGVERPFSATSTRSFAYPLADNRGAPPSPRASTGYFAAHGNSGTPRVIGNAIGGSSWSSSAA